MLFLLYVILNLCISASHQQQRPRIVSGPSHLVIGKKHGNITFDWSFKLLPGRTWIQSVEDVAFGLWKAPGYLQKKLMVIDKHGKLTTRQNYGNKISCAFNMSRMQVAFTVHNLSPGDENDYGLHVELGLARIPLKDVVALRLEDPPKIVISLERNISLRAGDKLVLNCRATGLPPPQVTWARSGRVFRNDTLVVNRVNKRDGGLYLCKAHSIAGEDSMRIFVRVEDGDKPTQATAAVHGLAVPAGQPAKLFFALPSHIHITINSYRGTRLYKDEIIFAVIHKGDDTPNCTIEEICQRLKVEVNTTCAKVEIPKTKISDGGSYSVEFLFTDVESNFIVSQKLDVIETGNTTVKPNVVVGYSSINPPEASSGAESGTRAFSALCGVIILMIFFFLLLKML